MPEHVRPDRPRFPLAFRNVDLDVLLKWARDPSTAPPELQRVLRDRYVRAALYDLRRAHEANR